MTGREFVELIERKGWYDAELWLSKDGIAVPVEEAEALFPNLSNANEVVFTDGNDVKKENDFWNTFYGRYINIITVVEADVEVQKGSPDFYILYCDGTEGKIDQNISLEEWEIVKSWDVKFGYEK